MPSLLLQYNHAAIMKNKQEYIQRLFTELYLAVAQDVERFALHLTRNRGEAKEILSVVLAATWESFEGIQSHAAFKSYLFTAIRREFYAQRRRSNRFELLEDERIEQLYNTVPQPDAQLGVNDLYAALGKLNNEQREAVILAEIYGYSHKEIAEIQQSSIANVKVRIHRAKQQLRALLGELPSVEEDAAEKDTAPNNRTASLPPLIV